jgi:hypothetical protein
MRGIEVGRLGLQDRAVERFGPGVLARLVMLQPEAYRLVRS